MVSVPTLLSLAFGALVCFGLPALLGALLKKRYPQEKIGRAVLLGTLGFLLTQVCVRLPLLSALSGNLAFFSALRPIPYALLLAFSAALFETAGRLLVQKVLLRRRLTQATALASGVGHGGVEAVLLVGINDIAGLAVGLAGDPASAGYVSLLSVSPALFALAGFERLLTILFHVFLSWLLGRAILKGRTGRGVLLCLALHTFADACAGLLAGHVGLLYAVLTLTVAGCAAAFFLLRRRDAAEAGA